MLLVADRRAEGLAEPGPDFPFGADDLVEAAADLRIVLGR
ncbi:hypothetical protein BKA15_003783 [Microlunatus parietis]|uniref:Uncharacterized protein n=1 Tax=Microlunatus parietis TaxID=682979 RepID=A0A7Y9I9V0_9ACTN|nr:hypothetical protein [Microlunatus parietis]